MKALIEDSHRWLVRGMPCVLGQSTGSPCKLWGPISVNSQSLFWRNRAPPRVQFFAWLLARQRLNCRANLSAKHLLDDAKCEVCSVEDEDCQHLILSCPFASQAWHALGMDAGQGEVTKLWAFPRPTSIPSKHFDSFVLLICWNLWKHRNEVIFRSLPPSHRRLWDACRSEAREWSYRWKREDYLVCDALCTVFSDM